MWASSWFVPLIKDLLHEAESHHNREANSQYEWQITAEVIDIGSNVCHSVGGNTWTSKSNNIYDKNRTD